MEIIILKEGTHEDKPGSSNIARAVENICSTVVLLKSEINILVDPGNFGFEDDVLNALESHGLTPEDIHVVINTHAHLDHISNNYLFKHAKIITACPETIWYDTKVDVFKNIENIDLPVKLIRTPGHIDKHLSVIAKGDDGKVYVIAGDAVTERQIKSGNPEVLNPDFVKSAKKIFEVADVIIPGHGPIIQDEKFGELREIVEQMEV